MRNQLGQLTTLKLPGTRAALARFDWQQKLESLTRAVFQNQSDFGTNTNFAGRLHEHQVHTPRSQFGVVPGRQSPTGMRFHPADTFLNPGFMQAHLGKTVAAQGDNFNSQKPSKRPAAT